MLSEDLIAELGALIRRLERRIRLENVYTDRTPEDVALQGIEDAIIGLVLLHIQMRKQNNV